MSDRLSELLDTLKSEASSGNEYNNRLAVAAAEKDVREYIDARIAAERERCAGVCEELIGGYKHLEDARTSALNDAAYKIRMADD